MKHKSDDYKLTEVEEKLLEEFVVLNVQTS